MEYILATLDGSRVSEQVLPYVEALALRTKMPVTVLRVYEGREGRASSYLSAITEDLIHKGINAKYHTLEVPATKSVPQAIVSYADETGAFLIAMATHGRSGISQSPYGNTAQEVLRTCPLPLLLVRASANPLARPPSLEGAVLLTLDGSTTAEQAIPCAEKLARKMHAEIVLFRVSEPAYEIMPVGNLPTFTSPAEQDKTLRRQATDYLTTICGQIKAHRRAQVRAEVQLGLPQEALVKRAGQADISLLVMCTHGRSGLSCLIHGCVAGRVINSCPVPVVIVRAR